MKLPSGRGKKKRLFFGSQEPGVNRTTGSRSGPKREGASAGSRPHHVRLRKAIRIQPEQKKGEKGMTRLRSDRHAMKETVTYNPHAKEVKERGELRKGA